jgi:hypothetical protein
MQAIYHALEATGKLTSNEQILLDAPLHNKKIDRVRLIIMYQDNVDKRPEQITNNDWRSHMEITPEILVSSDELIKPVEFI